MGANINIYQDNQIGGCITVISTEKTKIVIDFGENLPGPHKEANIEFDWEKEKVDAVFFTHYHGDHIGRFMEIPDNVDLYMGEVTYKVMLNIRRAVKDDAAVSKLTDRLENGSITFVERNTPICINDDIVVTGYDIDHSAYDAFMYLVEADGTNILHTGDFRDHGHRGRTIKNGVEHNTMLDVINYYVHKNGRQVDVLITEGTMIGERADEERFSEKDLCAWAKEYFKEHRYIFLKVSSTNVDTLASFYQAGKANGMTMYANSYILKQFRVYRAAGRKRGTRMYDFYEAKQIPFISDREDADNTEAYQTLDEMRKNGFVAIVSEYEQYERVMDELADVNPEMIYSMWSGYIDPNRDAYNEKMAAFCKKYHAFQKHTSGHAYPEFIAQVITAVNPTQMIWPIHTENAEGFMELDISDELKRRVKNMRAEELIEDLKNNPDKVLTLYRNVYNLPKTEVEPMAKYICDNKDIFDDIKPVIRANTDGKGGWKYVNYREANSSRIGKAIDPQPDVQLNKSGKHTRNENYLAYDIYNSSNKGNTWKTLAIIGNVLDYEMPLGGTLDYLRGDEGKIENPDKKGCKYKPGKVDLVSYNPNTKTFYLIELKDEDNDESLLRASIEPYTYLKLLKKDKFIRNMQEIYPELKIQDDAKFIAAILVLENSKMHCKYKDFENSKWQHKLIEDLKEEVIVCQMKNKEVKKIYSYAKTDVAAF